MPLRKDSTIVVTGAAGFIGSNFVKFLNSKGFDNLILVDDLKNGKKFKNLKGAKFTHYLDKDDLLDWLNREGVYTENFLMGVAEEVVSGVEAIVHLGATSETTEWDGKLVMSNNYKFTLDLLSFCQNWGTRFIYASSASVYGNSQQEEADPLNIYAFSKFCIDQFVERYFKDLDLDEAAPQIVGLRFFNVYGPGEEFKGEQASPVHKFFKQLAQPNGKIKLFKGSEQFKRDFVHVSDVCSVVYWFLENIESSGIFDVGTGEPRSFKEVACAVENVWTNGIVKTSYIEEVDFPKHLKGHYQTLTRANLNPLRSVGCQHKFISLEEGIRKM